MRSNGAGTREGREPGGQELAGQHVAVIGLGASGVAATRLAITKGAEVYVSESRSDDAAAARGAALGSGIPGHVGAAGRVTVDVGSHDVDRIADADIVVASPGIPPDAPVLRALAERGVRWISEPELAARFFTGSLIAVTGTNGKTTTTLLVDHLLHASGIRSAAGGNVGGGLAPAASDLARRDDQPDWIVLEMSSFQLAGVKSFRPVIGVVTNLSPDHLDRYADVEHYYADKHRLFDHAGADSTWVLPASDATVEAWAAGVPGRRFRFGPGDESDAFVDEGVLTLRIDGEIEPLIPVEELPLLGAHNVTNALTAALTARLAGAGEGGLAAGLGSVRALPHRLEPVVERDGVLWVNDSKATNVAATRSAIDSLDRPVVLLLGGKDKGEAFGPLVAAMRGRVRAVVVYGAVAERAEAELADAELAAKSPGDAITLKRIAGGLDEVVRTARELARPGDVVLLSPACSSYDMYESYEHRGRHFAQLAGDAS